MKSKCFGQCAWPFNDISQQKPRETTSEKIDHLEKLKGKYSQDCEIVRSRDAQASNTLREVLDG